MTKQYKAGQIVTIDGKRYRLRNTNMFLRCHSCTYRSVLCNMEPCRSCIFEFRFPQLYLEPLRRKQSKSSNGNKN